MPSHFNWAFGSFKLLTVSRQLKGKQLISLKPLIVHLALITTATTIFTQANSQAKNKDSGRNMDDGSKESSKQPKVRYEGYLIRRTNF